VSNSFAGLTKTDVKADSLSILNHSWVNISSGCNFPVTQNGTETSTVLLNDYRGDTIVLAFRYKTANSTGFQPMWTINNLQISSTLIRTGKEISNQAAATMSFTPFDMNNLASGDVVYQSGTTGGVWDISTPASLKIRQTTSGRPMNEDWLISKPIAITRGMTEKGKSVPVKNITVPVDFYTHTFELIGEYFVTFTASNYNYHTHSSIQKTVKIIID
jgi:hypothetical protein